MDAFRVDMSSLKAISLRAIEHVSVKTTEHFGTRFVTCSREINTLVVTCHTGDDMAECICHYVMGFVDALKSFDSLSL